MKKRLAPSIALSIALAGCASADRAAESTQVNKATRATSPEATTTGMIAMTIWTVPKDSFKVGEIGDVQVSILPLISMNMATLHLTTSNEHIKIVGPASFTLMDLKRAPLASDAHKKSAHNPPALGMTVVRNFQVLADKAGSYTARITFSYADKNQYRDVVIIAR